MVIWMRYMDSATGMQQIWWCYSSRDTRIQYRSRRGRRSGQPLPRCGIRAPLTCSPTRLVTCSIYGTTGIS